jgi:diaminohydroxyphosphoribosylaminopyrimidine deaminase / 5-amino-6-(5-phosphoribosylamino)uracil reductase
MQSSVLSAQDRRHLRRALELARRGLGRVSPNPPVGAVIAAGESGEVLAEGWHEELGALHAETAALADARERGNEVQGATIFVTLEPCAHHGRQPPCAETIAAAGIARVVVGCEDPSAKAEGRGPAILREAGVAVDFADGEERADSRLLIQPFRKHARTGRPLVVLKSAVTLDGRTATPSGQSRWISGESSRQLVHRWRARSDAVAVGIGTVLDDDPSLTARGVEATRQPCRVVFDRNARLPLNSRLVRSAGESPVLVIADPEAPTERLATLVEAGIEPIVAAGAPDERLRHALAELGNRGITSLLLEGGATLAAAFQAAGELDELRLFVAPLLLGGADSRPLIGGAGPDRLEAAERALALECERIGEDLLLTARLREW